mgnify:CR=1 FL=1
MLHGPKFKPEDYKTLANDLMANLKNDGINSIVAFPDLGDNFKYNYDASSEIMYALE